MWLIIESTKDKLVLWRWLGPGCVEHVTIEDRSQRSHLPTHQAALRPVDDCSDI